jgi:Ca-activated chloride channel homolog
MKTNYFSLIIISSILFIFTISCAGDDSADYDSSNNSNNMNNVNNVNNTNNGGNVNIGGIQDIGLFREIIESGDIPAPTTLNANGFFSEHYLDYPFTECGDSLCLNGMLGRGTSILSNDYMNVLQVVIKSYVDPSDYERPPTDFIAVIDVSGSMYTDNKLQSVKEGLHLMVDKLNPEDRLALVSYSDWANELLPLSYASTTEEKNIMHDAIETMVPTGSTNIYDGLLSAFDIAGESQSQERYARIVFLSDGVPTSGITDESAIIALAQENSSDTVQLTSIGVGYDLNFDLMKELAMSGGNFYFIEDNASLLDIFVQEVDFFSFPIAKDISISLTSGSSFYAGDSVGFDDWNPTNSGGTAYFPALYAASRVSSSSEDPSARRGGGSALFVRLVATDNTGDLSGMVLSMDYTDSLTGESSSQNVSVSELAGGDGTVSVDSYYSEDVMKKSFVMLNIYLALKEVCQRAVNYDYDGARSLLMDTIDHTYYINETLQDDDLNYDLELMEQLLQNFGVEIEDDDYYCDTQDCYYDNEYSEEENVHYGCSTSGGSLPSLPIIFLLFSMIFIIKKRNKSVL